MNETSISGISEVAIPSSFSVLEMVSFYNTVNYLTTQMNNETSFENTTKGLL